MKTTKQFLKFMMLLSISTVFGQNTVFQTSGGVPNGQGVVGNALFGVTTGASLIAGSNSSGCYNTFIGQGSGTSNTSGSGNTYLGNGAGSLSTIGSGNAFLGRGTGARCTGDRNTLLGAGAGAGSSAYGGADNVFVGSGSGANAANASVKNVFVGANSGLNNQGTENVFIGFQAGFASNLSSGSNNVFLGTNAGAGATGGSADSNKLRIHSIQSPGFTNSPLIFGDFVTRDLTFNVFASPTSRVSIVSGVPNNSLNGTSGLNFVNLTSTSNTAFTSNGKVLTVNAAGDVVLTTDQVGPGGNINITPGTNVTVAGNGSAGTPYIINAKNIYTNDDKLSGNRTVDMDNKQLYFDTKSTGAIYIGNQFAGFNATSFPTTTGNYKLYVDGGILAEKLRVALTGTLKWADYVFADNYKLMPLKEVEVFVKENKHLPGIESAQELTKNGLDIGNMQAKQMEKIEELTLHLIEQNKMLEKQSGEIEELKAQMKVLLEKK